MGEEVGGATEVMGLLSDMVPAERATFLGLSLLACDLCSNDLVRTT